MSIILLQLSIVSNIIQVSHLTKRYAKATQNAVDDISFGIPEGSFFALLGPNGAGKTTTISILSTTLAKTSGTVTIAGYDLDKNPSAVRRNIGLIFQNPSLDANLTAEENVRFHAVLYGLYTFKPLFRMMPEAYQRSVMELADVLDLKQDLFKPIKSYSGGMKRKLEIIRSIMHHPKVLILDEPTSGLDPVSRKNLWEYLMEVRKKEKMTVFLTTHYLEEAEGADSVCIINHGKIVSLGTPDQIKRHLVEEYIVVDAADRNILQKELAKHKQSYKGNGPFTIALGKKRPQEMIHTIRTPLTSLRIHAPTLEEAYLEIIGATHERT